MDATYQKNMTAALIVIQKKLNEALDIPPLSASPSLLEKHRRVKDARDGLNCIIEELELMEK